MTTYLTVVLLYTVVATDITKIEPYIKQVMECNHVPGFTISVVQLDDDGNDLISYSKGFGNIDLTCNDEVEQCEKINGDTVFGIGSITKQFTALTLWKVLIDDPRYRSTMFKTRLSQFFNKSALGMYPGSDLSDFVTIQDILSHRLGIPSNDVGWLFGMRKNRSEAWENIPSLLARKPYHENFRNSFTYNNWMYTLAGYLIEKVTGKSYETVIRRDVYDKLGMYKSDFIFNLTRRTDVARWAIVVNASFVKADQAIGNDVVEIVSPAGSIATSANDMNKYMKAILTDDDSLFHTLPLDAMRIAHNLLHPYFSFMNARRPKQEYSLFKNSYGLGFIQGTYNGYERISHGGSVAGYQSGINFYPGLNLGVFCSQANVYEDVAGQCDEVAARIVDLVTEVENSPFDDQTVICGNIWNTPSGGESISLQTVHDSAINEVCAVDQTVVGTYTHPLFDSMKISFNDQLQTLHWSYGVYGNAKLCMENRNMAILKFLGPQKDIFQKLVRRPIILTFERDRGKVVRLKAVFFAVHAPPVFTKD